jgi:TPR repeat protein
MQWWTKAAEQGDLHSQLTIREIYLTGLLDERVPVGTFDKDVPRGMKTLRAVIDQKSEAGAPYVAKNIQAAYAKEYPNPKNIQRISKAEALIRAFHAAKSCMGCGRPKARKLCGGCVDAGHAKARYCGKACQLVHCRRRRTKPSADLAPPPATAAPARRESEAT